VVRRLFVPACFFSLVAVTAVASESLPFDKYPSRIFRGKPAVPQLRTPLALEHRTAIRNGAKHGPNFAGHYTVVDWGCGTSCGVYVIMDARTGEIHEPPEISKGVDLGIAGPEFRPNSKLMVVASCPPPEVYGFKNCERKFCKWDGSHLVLIKTESMTSALDKPR